MTMLNKQKLPTHDEQDTQKRARAAQNEYQRRYRREHPDRVKRWQEAYWARKASQAEQASPASGEEVSE